MSKVNFPWCNLSPLLLVVLMHMEHSLLCSSMQQLFMCLQAAVMTPLSLLFSKLNNFSNMYKGWFLKVLSSCCSCCFYSGDWEWKNFPRVDDQAVLSGALQMLIGMKGTKVFIAVYVHSCLHNKSVFTGPVTNLLTASPGQEQLHKKTGFNGNLPALCARLCWIICTKAFSVFHSTHILLHGFFLNFNYFYGCCKNTVPDSMLTIYCCWKIYPWKSELKFFSIPEQKSEVSFL